MNSKMMALVGGVLLCGLTVFGDQSNLYDNDGLKYEIGNAKFTSFGNNICAYDVRVTIYNSTNETYATAVVFYNSTYGTMKIFLLSQSAGFITATETRWTGGSGTFSGRLSEGSLNTEEATFSWDPIYPTFSKIPSLKDGVAVNGESALAPAPLSAAKDISVPKGSIYRFTAGVSPYYFVFYVFSDEVLDCFPNFGRWPYEYGRAMAMYVEVYCNNQYISSNEGIFYAYQWSSNEFRTYHTVFPSSAFPVSFSVLVNYFNVRSQNYANIFTLAQDSNKMVIQFLGD